MIRKTELMERLIQLEAINLDMEDKINQLEEKIEKLTPKKGRKSKTATKNETTK